MGTDPFGTEKNIPLQLWLTKSTRPEGAPFAEQTKKRLLTCQSDEVRMAGRPSRLREQMDPELQRRERPEHRAGLRERRR